MDYGVGADHFVINVVVVVMISYLQLSSNIIASRSYMACCLII
jgi:hypothetical protein